MQSITENASSSARSASPGGADKIPGVDALQKRLNGYLRQTYRPGTSSHAANQRVLVGSFGTGHRRVRAKIEQMLWPISTRN